MLDRWQSTAAATATAGWGKWRAQRVLQSWLESWLNSEFNLFCDHFQKSRFFPSFWLCIEWLWQFSWIFRDTKITTWGVSISLWPPAPRCHSPQKGGGGLESRWHQCWEFEMARLGAFIGGLCLFFSFESRPEADGSCCYVRLVGMILWISLYGLYMI